MARFEFDDGTEVGEAFKRIGLRNRVGRKHLHQPRGRARERARKKMGPVKAKEQKRRDQYHALVAAYWRSELEYFPEFEG